MRCSEIRAQLDEYASGRVGTQARQEIERHLAACGECREISRVARQTAAWLRIGRETPPDAGPAFWTGLRAAIAERQTEPGLFWFPLDLYLRRLAYGLTALALVLGIYLALTEAPLGSDWSEAVALDSPQPYTESVFPTVKQGRVDRDEVMLTLVTEPEVGP